MKLPGYRRQPSDPLRSGVMQPPPPRMHPQLRRLGFHPLCLLGRHRVGYYRLSAPGEQWGTFIFLCRRCRRVVGDSQAARAETPVTSNK